MRTVRYILLLLSIIPLVQSIRLTGCFLRQTDFPNIQLVEETNYFYRCIEVKAALGCKYDEQWIKAQVRRMNTQIVNSNPIDPVWQFDNGVRIELKGFKPEVVTKRYLFDVMNHRTSLSELLVIYEIGKVPDAFK